MQYHTATAPPRGLRATLRSAVTGRIRSMCKAEEKSTITEEQTVVIAQHDQTIPTGQGKEKSQQ